MIKSFFCVSAIVSFFVIAGCGSVVDGTTTVMNYGTVTLPSVTPLSANFNSTVGSIPTTADTNVVTLTISNTPYPNTTTTSGYTINNIVVSYTNNPNSKFVLSDPIISSTSMISGGSVAIPMTIATPQIKNLLLTNGFSSGTPWSFYVTVSFTVVEDIGGKSVSYQNVGLATVQFI